MQFHPQIQKYQLNNSINQLKYPDEKKPIIVE